MLHAYVDEFGDRGTSAASSRFFGMAGVVVDEPGRSTLNDVVREIRDELRVPPGKPLHWQEHVKTHGRRQFVTTKLLEVPGAVVNYVLFEKASIPRDASLRVDRAKFYNYVAGIMLERLILTAMHWQGGTRPLSVRFGHVRGFDHHQTTNYFQIKKVLNSWINWDLLTGEPKFLDAGAAYGLQAADMYAGMMNVATVVDRYGGFEPHHLLRVHPQIRRRPRDGSSLNWGFKPFVQPDTLDRFPWWPPTGI